MAKREFKPLERLKNRAQEFRKRLEERRKGGRGQLIQGKLGGGKLIERVRERSAKFSEKVQEFKPGLLSGKAKILGEWYPGKRLVNVLTPKVEGGGTTAPAPTGTTKEKKGKRIPHY